ncbi:outer membrane lipid asymmetry maintenance protein MlaD [Cognatishimia sp.]|uniref:outer membrane lipid asymmetry maintenance protein MlaD n=1 Tax=Cognatishimia sp. TaxID=2211648 RepID=UPI003513B68B
MSSSTQRTEIAVGGLVLAAAIGFAAYMGQVASFGSGGAGYELSASFRSIEGVSVGSDVRLAGVKVGTVTAIELDPVTFRANTTVNLQNDILLPDDSAIVISSEGLLGGNFVEVLPGGSPFNLEPGSEIFDTQGAVSLVSLLMRFVGGGDE